MQTTNTSTYTNHYYPYFKGHFGTSTTTLNHSLHHIDSDDLREQVMDYLNYKTAFEGESASERIKMLNPHFLEQIKGYLYKSGEAPEYMDCWDAPIEVLEQYGITHKVLNIK
jgi:hypothetical protein